MATVPKWNDGTVWNEPDKVWGPLFSAASALWKGVIRLTERGYVRMTERGKVR